MIGELNDWNQPGGEWIQYIDEIHHNSSSGGSVEVDAEDFLRNGAQQSGTKETIIGIGIMPENILAADLFDLCDLDMKIGFGGAFATGFNSSDIIQIARACGVEEDNLEDTLRRLKIMGSASAACFNEQQSKSGN